MNNYKEYKWVDLLFKIEVNEEFDTNDKIQVLEHNINENFKKLNNMLKPVNKDKPVTYSAKCIK